jgi:hypothetical protein
MNIDLLLDLLRSHLAALKSHNWPGSGPAFYLDASETQALIVELTAIRKKLVTAGVGYPRRADERQRLS